MIIKEDIHNNYIPISPLLLIHDTGRLFDTYMRMGISDKYLLYARHGILTQKHKDVLLESNVRYLYLNVKDKEIYETYVQKNYGKLLMDSNIPISKRSKLFYEHSSSIIQRMFENKLPKKLVEDEFYKNLQLIIEYMYEFLFKYEDSFKCIGKLIDHDYKTYSHSVNVSIYTICMLQQMGYDKKLISEVGIGAILHDVGKTFISNEILQKPGKLTEEEFDIVKQHCDKGVDIVHKLPLSLISFNCILRHHEKLDGSGYPARLKEENIPIYVRAITIADIYDTLTSDRVYGISCTPFEALQIIKNEELSTGHLDKEIFKVLINILYNGISN